MKLSQIDEWESLIYFLVSCPVFVELELFPYKNPCLFESQNEPQSPLKYSVYKHWRNKNPEPGAEPRLTLVWVNDFDAQVLNCFEQEFQRVIVETG